MSFHHSSGCYLPVRQRNGKPKQCNLVEINDSVATLNKCSLKKLPLQECIEKRLAKQKKARGQWMAKLGAWDFLPGSSRQRQQCKPQRLNVTRWECATTKPCPPIKTPGDSTYYSQYPLHALEDCLNKSDDEASKIDLRVSISFPPLLSRWGVNPSFPTWSENPSLSRLPSPPQDIRSLIIQSQPQKWPAGIMCRCKRESNNDLYNRKLS